MPAGLNGLAREFLDFINRRCILSLFFEGPMRTIAQQLAFEIEAQCAQSLEPRIEAGGQSCDSFCDAGAGVGVKKSENGAALGENDPAADLLTFVGARRFATVLADPPWRFTNRTGKMAPEHRRLSRYGTMTANEIGGLPVPRIVTATAHLYLWVPNALLPEGLRVMQAWGFEYKTNVIWHKLRKDGGSDGRGVGFYFRNVTEMILFGVRGRNARTLQPGRTQVNYIGTRKREHSRKPDEQYPIIEACSPGPYLELFARGTRPDWATWGNQADDEYRPTWPTYAHHSQAANGLSD